MQWVLMAPHPMGSPLDNGFVCIVCPFPPLKKAPPLFVPWVTMGGPTHLWVGPPISLTQLNPIHRESQNLLSVAENRRHKTSVGTPSKVLLQFGMCSFGTYVAVPRFKGVRLPCSMLRTAAECTSQPLHCEHSELMLREAWAMLRGVGGISENVHNLLFPHLGFYPTVATPAPPKWEQTWHMVKMLQQLYHITFWEGAETQTSWSGHFGFSDLS